MIVKGRARGRSAQLAHHLLRRDQNEVVRVREVRGTIARDVEGALAELEAQGRAGRSKRPLYHASISPEPGTRLTGEQITYAVDVLEEKLGLSAQPRLVVSHVKGGREHLHIVWSRINDVGHVISDSWSYAAHEQAAREIERAFGHRAIRGRFSRFGNPRERGRTTVKEYEHRQSERSGIDRKAASQELTELWNASNDAADFAEAVHAAGYTLARGDRRGFVIVDRAGEVHSLTRRLAGVSSAEVKTKLENFDVRRLPAVKDVRRSRQGPSREKQNKAARGSLDIRTYALQPELRLRRLYVGRGKNQWAARRAVIEQEFASKIAAASSSGTRDEIAERIRRLREEEYAALASLARERQPVASSGHGIARRFRLAAKEVAVRRRRARIFLRPSDRAP